jgi:HNH endonuclease
MTDVPIDPSNPAVRAAVLYDISPYGEDFFPVPSTDGVPFVLYIRYTSETITDETRFRSQAGHDSEENLMTLCSSCHSAARRS